MGEILQLDAFGKSDPVEKKSAPEIDWLCFTINSKPRGKATPQSNVLFDKKGNVVKSKETGRAVIIHRPTKDHDTDCKKLEALFYQHAPKKPFRGPIWLGIKAFFQLPGTVPEAWKSVAPPKNKYAWFEASALSGEVRPLGRPDYSNILKHVEDIGTGIFWLDDSQIVGPGSWGGKFYARVPRYEISIGYRTDFNRELQD